MEQELAIKLQSQGISYLTQVAIPITSVDLYLPTNGRPLLVFVDGSPHLKTKQMMKDEETRTLLRKKGYRVLELRYRSYSDRVRDEFFRSILDALGNHAF